VEQGILYNTKDGGVSADAEGQREDGYGCESRILAQQAQPETHVLDHCFKER
jgi:hypothetical protein